jgi:hypothetical protein
MPSGRIPPRQPVHPHTYVAQEPQAPLQHLSHALFPAARAAALPRLARAAGEHPWDVCVDSDDAGSAHALGRIRVSLSVERVMLYLWVTCGPSAS